MSNPLLETKFKPGNRWDQVNSMRIGASLAVCGKKPELHDPRPYGIALTETSYPLLKQLFQGMWGDAEQAECLRLLRDGITRSSPMSTAALLMLQNHSVECRDQIWQALTAKERSRLSFQIEVAKADPDLKQFFA